MKDFVTYLSTAPVIAFAWISFTAGLLIEINLATRNDELVG